MPCESDCCLLSVAHFAPSQVPQSPFRQKRPHNRNLESSTRMVAQRRLDLFAVLPHERPVSGDWFLEKTGVYPIVFPLNQTGIDVKNQPKCLLDLVKRI